MRSLIVTEFLSLDGVVDSPGGGEHPHAGWTFKDVEFDMAAYELKGREQQEAGAMLIGRVSYDEFAPVWPTMEEFAEYNAMPKYVVSSTLTDPTWNNTTVIDSDVVAAVTALKEQPGRELQVHGSCGLVHTLHDAGLVDEYRLIVAPVVLGSGKKLFAEGSAPTGFGLVTSERTAAGCLYAVLRPSGEVRVAEAAVQYGKDVIV